MNTQTFCFVFSVLKSLKKKLNYLTLQLGDKIIIILKYSAVQIGTIYTNLR
jgi:hypothetical protein